jgi:HEPN superfamily Swt1-like protein
VTAAEALQAFLYRGLSANVRVTEMLEEGALRETPRPGAVRELSILDEFDIISRVKAGRMGRIYELLFCLENSMRELIERTFKESDEFTDWTEGIEEKILNQARKREKEDQNAPWHGPRGGSILSYLDFPQLGDIILGQWDHFQDLFGDRGWCEYYFREMNPARRALAHTGDLSEFDVERMEMRVREWLMVVG